MASSNLMRLFGRHFRCQQFVQTVARRAHYVINSSPPPCPKVQHLICFKDWTPFMIMKIVQSALNLKSRFPDTRGIRLQTLNGAKVMILQEVNRPIQQSAVSKAATLLGAQDLSIVDKVVWDEDYMGRIFSGMADVIFVSTSKHMCVRRFAEHSSVPVLCMHSRTHSSLLALAAIMTMVENFQTMNKLSVAYLGPPHPILNSLLLLCPMLGANFKFKCCCERTPLTPLLFKTSEDLSKDNNTEMKSCSSKSEIFKCVNVMIAGPTTKKKGKLKYFTMDVNDLNKNACENWIFLHICPRGKEVKDNLFFHDKAKTFTMFDNMHYIAAALMFNAIIGNTQ